jgi:hypothetical protein
MFEFRDALDQEWAALNASPEGRRAIIRWANSDPAFAGVEDLDALARRNTDRSDELLAALVRLAPSDTVAARTMLQALRPGLLRLAAHYVRLDRGAFEELVSLAWVRIRTYPATRRGPVAANVLMDVRKQFIAHRILETCGDADDRLARLEVTDDINSPESALLGKALLAEMAGAHRRGQISEEELRSIVRTRLFGDPVAEVAADAKISSPVFRQRRWRAEARLRQLALAG